MAAKVTRKCKYCGKDINIAVEPYGKVCNNTRYAHSSCIEKEANKATAYRNLTDYIQKLYSPYEPNWKMIVGQIKQYEQLGYTYDGMRLTLVFVYDIMGLKLDKTKGVGVIPYKYQAARKYYERQDNLYTKAEVLKHAEEKLSATKTDIVTVENPKRTKKLIDFHY